MRARACHWWVNGWVVRLALEAVAGCFQCCLLVQSGRSAATDPILLSACVKRNGTANPQQRLLLMLETPNSADMQQNRTHLKACCVLCALCCPRKTLWRPPAMAGSITGSAPVHEEKFIGWSGETYRPKQQQVGFPGAMGQTVKWANTVAVFLPFQQQQQPAWMLCLDTLCMHVRLRAPAGRWWSMPCAFIP